MVSIESGTFTYSALDVYSRPEVVPPGLLATSDSASVARPVALPDSNVSASRYSGGTCGNEWRPTSIAAVGNFSTVYPGSRYGRTDFSWASGYEARLANFQACRYATWETDFVTYNYGGFSFYQPQVIKGWSSNLPRSYRDTTLFDSGNELVYTIGSADADQITTGTSYFTYFYANPGNSTLLKAKINIQRGERTPATCYSAYCIFAKATDKYIPAWKLTPRGTTVTYQLF